MSQIGPRTIRRIGWRLLPLLILAYLMAYIDRVNVGFAALQMNKDLGFSATVYGWGAGIFFIGYFLFEVPSNLAMERVGARRWLARIMISWGIISAATALIVGTWSFTIMRFLLGAAEAGFFPGVILYLTYWFPPTYRARIIAWFMVAIPLSSALGSPISAAMLGIDAFGLRGWQWMFLLEGLPAVLLGLYLLFVLPDSPADARGDWLPDEEHAWLTGQLEDPRAASLGRPSIWTTLLRPRMFLFALIYAGVTASSIGLSLWTPQIIKAHGLSTTVTGMLNTIPYAVACVAMVLWGRSSDATGERRWHTLGPIALLTVALFAGTYLTGLWPALLALTAAACGAYMVKGPFWALATEGTPSNEQAASIAAVNAIGNLSGFVGPYLVGLVRDLTGSFEASLYPLLAFAILALVLTWVAPQKPASLPAAAAALNVRQGSL